MSAKIAGMGWVTPLGAGLEEVWVQEEVASTDCVYVSASVCVFDDVSI